jgi:hypothetical protein
VFRKHRQLADDLRQFPIAGTIEAKPDFALTGLLCLHHVPIVRTVERAVFLQYIE